MGEREDKWEHIVMKLMKKNKKGKTTLSFTSPDFVKKESVKKCLRSKKENTAQSLLLRRVQWSFDWDESYCDKVFAYNLPGTGNRLPSRDPDLCDCKQTADHDPCQHSCCCDSDGCHPTKCTT